MTDEGDGAVTPAAATARGAASAKPENPTPEAGQPPARVGTLSPQTRDRIASQLRAMYETVAQQPVPDRFAELIAKLDANDRRT